MGSTSSVDVVSGKARNGGGIQLSQSDAATVAAAAEGDELLSVEALKWDKEANIFVRLMRAAFDVPKLEKDGNNEKAENGKPKSQSDGKGLPYAFITHDLVSMHAKKVLVKHGIYFMPEMIEAKQEGNRTEIRINGHFINVDKPEDRVSYPGIGYGIDNSDKGPGKAWSYACKYVLAKALMMSTADDIETTNATFEPDAAHAVKQEAKQNKNQTLQAWGKSFKSALTNAKTVAEVDKLQKENSETLMSDDTPDVTREFFVDLIQERKALLGGEHA